MSLPPLHQLRLELQGDATGAGRLGGGVVAARPSRGAAAAAAQKWQPAGEPGAALLETIAEKLKDTTQGNLRGKWQDAIVASMQHKEDLFTEKAAQLGSQIKDAEAKVDAYVAKARIAFGNDKAVEEGKKDDGRRAARRAYSSSGGSSAYSASVAGTHTTTSMEAPFDVTWTGAPTTRGVGVPGALREPDSRLAGSVLGGAAIPRGSGSGADPNPTKWDVAEKVYESWSALVYAKEAFEEIAAAAAQRKSEVDTAASALMKAKELSEVITELVDDFKNQTYLLASLSDLILAFIENPLVAQNTMINIVLMGNPGTGKTRLADKLGAVLSKLGLFVYDEVVVSGRSDYIGEYEGQTAAKTKRFLVANLEKVIFLDEAYSLTSYEQKPGQPVPELTAVAAEAIAECIAFMSEWPGSSCIIAAGYEDEMKNKFLKANAGFTRRFYLLIELEDYSPDQLVDDIYIKALAKAMEGKKLPEPVTKERANAFFNADALRYLKAVIAVLNTSRTAYAEALRQHFLKYRTRKGEWPDPPPKEYPAMDEFFGAQAGAMVILANITATKIASNSDGRMPGPLSWVLTPASVHVLLTQMLENRYGKAAEELIEHELDEIKHTINRDGSLQRNWGKA